MEQVNLFIITASENYFNQALLELREVDKDLTIVENLFNGIFFIQPSFDKNLFKEKIVNSKPIFIRHMHAVDTVIQLDETVSLENISNHLEQYKDILEHADKTTIQVRKGKTDYAFSPAEIREALFSTLKNRFNIEPEVKHPETIISVFVHNDKCYMGLGDPIANLSDWSGGMVHYKKSDEDISRAKYKLMEAIYAFKIDMHQIQYALDLGAAPGGWTSVLLEYGIRVTAVDTGDMDSRLLKYKNLSVLKQNVSELRLETESFDFITSDISWSPLNTANMVNQAGIFLKHGGLAVVTVKLMGSKIGKKIKEVKNVYQDQFEILGIKQLFHNRDEITIYMKKK